MVMAVGNCTFFSALLPSSSFTKVTRARRVVSLTRSPAIALAGPTTRVFGSARASGFSETSRQLLPSQNSRRSVVTAASVSDSVPDPAAQAMAAAALSQNKVAVTWSPFGLPWILHGFLLAISVSISWTFFNGSLFGYHPLLFSFGYFFFMAEGILGAIQAKGKSRKPYLTAHSILQALSALAIVAGFLVIYQNKALAGKAHFTSYHAKVALVTLAASFGAFVGGLPLYFGIPKALKKLAPTMSRGHKVAGAVAFIGASFTSFLGLKVFSPNKALHKGWITYALALAVLLTPFIVLRSAFAVLEAQKSVTKALGTEKSQ